MKKRKLKDFKQLILEILQEIDCRIEALAMPKEGWYPSKIGYGFLVHGTLVFILFHPELKRGLPQFKIELGWSREGTLPSALGYGQAFCQTFISDRGRTCLQSTMVTTLGLMNGLEGVFWPNETLLIHAEEHEKVPAEAPLTTSTLHPMTLLKKTLPELVQLATLHIDATACG